MLLVVVAQESTRLCYGKRRDVSPATQLGQRKRFGLDDFARVRIWFWVTYEGFGFGRRLGGSLLDS